ncbi:MAG TPA: FAD-binding and (Fe-S)-binding domain-containing protein [Caulobacteraceae bacterium]|nr:FAD-binding and (Fe-S)-binding domain-containing protein [Caulobacteraceae bacterium]
MSISHRVVDKTPSGRIAREGLSFPPIDARRLEDELRGAIEGEVRFGPGDKALYAADSSNYRQTPIGVVVPYSDTDVVRTIEICRAHDAPVVSRGGGTSLAGQTCNTAVVIDFSKRLNRILKLDFDSRLALVEPGVVLDSLRDAAEQRHLTFGPDPSTHDHNTLGGMIGNDSCGEHSIMSGRTADNVRSLDIVTYDGVRMTVGPTSAAQYRAIVGAGGRRAEIYRALKEFWTRYGRHFEAVYPQIPRRVSGYENLDQLSLAKGFNVARALVGTEATLVTVLKAELELVPSPPHRVLAIAGFPDIYTAADAVPRVLEFGPIALEGLDELMIDYMRRKHLHVDDLKVLPDGCGWLICEFGADSEDAAAAKAAPLIAWLQARGHDGRVVRDKAQQHRIMRVREAGLPATADLHGRRETHEGWEDAAVRREDLGRYLRQFKQLMHKYGYESSVYGHFGDGLVHCRINFDLSTEQGIATWTAFLNEAADLVVKYGGSLSGEHGDGQSKAALLDKMYGPELMAAQRAFKAIWDPNGRMNPGKVIDPYPIASNLRMGPDYRPMQVAGVFDYGADVSFTGAMKRCVGVGECRRNHSGEGVMCPSYQATLEERYSTRGRARLLFEMMRGGAIEDGFANEAVEEALDFCLGCKGCKSDCPMHVDMATWKAEFRYRHYQGRRRPRAAYAMGQIRRWAELAQIAPGLVNLATRAPIVSALGKRMAGIAPQRRIPAFAKRSFQAWRRAYPSAPNGKGRVLIWPDTFTNFFRPGAAIAATQVLERLGYTVDAPPQSLCCGRPLYDWGWLDEAKALWRRTLNALKDDIEAGVPLIGLEPGCVSAFRDELPALFPHDPAARRLSGQTVMLSEFLHQRGETLPKLSGQALVQIHCHHHAVLDPGAELKVLNATGLEAHAIPSGCCGMAGAFGFEASKYVISMMAADRVLTPAVRDAPASTLILANGFSCREQIEQATGRPTLHMAEALARGL